MLVALLLPGGPVAAKGAPEGAEPPESLVVSEVMHQAPPELQFPNGQWFEVYNPSQEPVLLSGLVLVVSGSDATSAAHTVSGLDAPVVGPHEYVVLGASKAQALNGAVPVAYSYGPGFVLPKSGGKLSLSLGDEVLDEVVFGSDYGLPVEPGHSLSLEPEGLSPDSNDLAAVWCESQGLFGLGPPPVYASPGVAGAECDSDGDGITGADGDCDDWNAGIAPGVQEKCNGLDDDCDGSADEEPLSEVPAWPTVGVCADAGPYCTQEGYWEQAPPPGYEPDGEVSCDFMDNDCDGQTDEGLRNACDSCGVLPDPCDGTDNDCDGQTDEDPMPAGAKGPGGCDLPDFGVCAGVVPVCAGASGWICPEPPEGYEAEEGLCDNLDNDCDGETDEGFEVGAPCASGAGSCRAEGTLQCAEWGGGVECVASPGQAGEELCGDNMDNDCDGETDEGFPIGEACTAGVGACRVTGKYFCSMEDGLAVMCSAQPLTPDTELCGTLEDEDCDGEVDEPDCIAAAAQTAPGCAVTGPGRSFLTLAVAAAICCVLLRLLAARRRSW
jgi:hypothetical protein